MFCALVRHHIGYCSVAWSLHLATLIRNIELCSSSFPVWLAFDWVGILKGFTWLSTTFWIWAELFSHITFCCLHQTRPQEKFFAQFQNLQTTWPLVQWSGSRGWAIYSLPLLNSLPNQYGWQVVVGFFFFWTRDCLLNIRLQKVNTAITIKIKTSPQCRFYFNSSWVWLQKVMLWKI